MCCDNDIDAESIDAMYHELYFIAILRIVKQPCTIFY